MNAYRFVDSKVAERVRPSNLDHECVDRPPFGFTCNLRDGHRVRALAQCSTACCDCRDPYSVGHAGIALAKGSSRIPRRGFVPCGTASTARRPWSDEVGVAEGHEYMTDQPCKAHVHARSQRHTAAAGRRAGDRDTRSMTCTMRSSICMTASSVLALRAMSPVAPR